jgi:methionine-S-sulfoxide reductase
MVGTFGRWARASALVALLASVPVQAETQAASSTAVFAGGCFWCTESDFEKVPGVLAVVSGYAGGTTANPTYETATAGGHVEVVKVTFDPAKVSYARLLDFYWRHVDLLDGGGQFCDRGATYRPAIFANGAEQKQAALASKSALEASKRFSKPIAVTVETLGPFTAAEDYHQDYYKKHPVKYKQYRYGCGRDQRLEELWGKDAAGH